MLPDLNEAIRCSLVCRNWRAAYEATIRPETLCLHFGEWSILQNHRLFYTNDRVSKFNFFKPPDKRRLLDPRFFHWQGARAHFANLKKLVIFAPRERFREFCFRGQLNNFNQLEHAEFLVNVQVPESCQIDLPFLKVLSFNQCSPRDVRIALNTPSLEALRFISSHEANFRITNFDFLFPSTLRHLETTNFEANLKFPTKFDNLQVLLFSDIARALEDDFERTLEDRLTADDFFESLPSLKFLIFNHEYADLAKLEAEKVNFNLNDLQIRQTSKFDYLNYQNWHWHLEHKEQLRYWPEFKVVFDKLIRYQTPLHLFKEGYFKIYHLNVRQVDDQALLVNLLRSTPVSCLELEYDCNLGPSFIDQIARSTIFLDRLYLDECVWNRMDDLSGLTRLNVLCFTLRFQVLQREAALAILRNRNWSALSFQRYRGFHHWVEGGELRKHSNISIPSHFIQRNRNGFVCSNCEWSNWNPLDSWKDPAEATLEHAKEDWR